jgi:glycosyltransferase involved in cell wall biosynthesis
MTVKNPEHENIMVSIFMVTYLHAEYIEQAINGVLIQECNFPIELIIADDKSPDNTEEVVRNFLKDHPKKHLVRYTRHKENKGAFENFLWITDQARGKYFANCDGDDYWIDPLKLQKQVDFLEKNPDYGLVYSRARIYEENKKSFWKMTLGIPINKRGILYENPIPSLTTVYRSALSKLYFKQYGEMRSNWAMGDYPKWIWFYYNSKIHFINEITAVWRKLESSASNNENSQKQMAFKYSTIQIQTYFGDKYLTTSENLELRNHLLNSYYHSALKLDPENSGVYYNQIKQDADLNQITKIKLFALEKIGFKYIQFTQLKVKKFLKRILKSLGFQVNG